MSSPRPYTRLWLVSALLLMAGLASRLILQFGANVADWYPAAIIFQCGFYAAGLVTLLAEHLRQAGEPEPPRIGCVSVIVVAVVCGFLVISTPPK